MGVLEAGWCPIVTCTLTAMLGSLGVGVVLDRHQENPVLLALFLAFTVVAAISGLLTVIFIMTGRPAFLVPKVLRDR